MIISIQLLRAVAAILVIFGHSYGRLKQLLADQQIVDPYSWHLITGIGVDIFFVISGFIMWSSVKKLRDRPDARFEFFKRRIFRIVPLYWFTTSLFLLTIVLGGKHHLPEVESLISSYLFLPYRLETQHFSLAFPVYDLGWTLNFEMFFYVLFAISLFKSKQLSWSILTLLIFGAVLGGLYSETSAMPVAFWTQPIIIEFYLGIILAIFFENHKKMHKFGAIFGVLIVCIALKAGILGEPTMINGTHLNDFSRVVAWGIPAALIVFFALYIPLGGNNPFTNTLKFLGDASYSLYLAHPFGLIVAGKVLATYKLTQSPAAILFVLVASAICFALATYLLIEKPITNYLEKFK